MKHQRPLVTVLDESIPDGFILTLLDVAAILNCDRGFARELVATGRMPGALHIGRMWRISAGKVRAWMKSETLPKNERIATMRDRARR